MIVVVAAGALFASARAADADVLTLTAKGRIDPACSISIKSPFPAADFSVPGNVAGSALVNCNTGFVVKATSENGKVKTDAATAPGFVNSLGYIVHFRLPVTNGVLTAVCSSSSLVAAASSCTLSPAGPGLGSSGQAALGTTATMTLSWVPLARTPLLAGAYHDTLTISVAAAP